MQKWRRVEGTELVAVIRDAFLVTVMWETQCRGANAGSWRLENLRVPGADGGMPTTYTGWELPLGSKLLFFPDSTKTGARDGSMEAVVAGGLLCCVTWLRWLLLARWQPG